MPRLRYQRIQNETEAAAKCSGGIQVMENVLNVASEEKIKIRSGNTGEGGTAAVRRYLKLQHSFLRPGTQENSSFKSRRRILPAPVAGKDSLNST